MADELDFEALKPSGKVKLAAAASGITGFWMLLFANQSYHIIAFRGIFGAIIVLEFLLAAAFVLLALQLFKLQPWTPWGGLVIGGLTALLTFGWLVFSFMNSVFSFMPIMVIPCAATTAALSLTAKADVERADLEREKMQDGGFDLGR